MTNSNGSVRPSASRKQQVRAAATLTVVGGSLVINGQPVAGASFEVTNTNATGPGSLLQAVNDANATNDFDTITFGAGAAGTIDIGAATLNLKYDVDIVGPGSGVVTLTNSAGNVIYLYNDSNASISGLTIDQAAEDAVSGRDFLSATISDVDITAPGAYGLVLYEVGVGVTMSNVSISDSVESGIWIDGRYGADVIGDVSVTMDQVDVANAGDNGIEIGNLDLMTISDSTVTAAGDRGIEVYPLRGSATITDTDVSGSGDEGIYFDGGSPEDGTVTLERVNVTDSGGHGLYLRGDQAMVLTDVTVDDSGDKGIYISDDADGVTMSNVSVNRSGDVGIEIEDVYGDVALTNVTVTDAGGVGIFIEDVYYAVTLNGVTVEGSTEAGIEMASVDGDVTITASTISDSGARGITVGGGGGTMTIEKSTITGSANEAIFASSQAGLTRVVNSTITQNEVGALSVVQFADSASSIESSTIAGNTTTGFVLFTADQEVALSNSIVTDNGTGSAFGSSGLGFFDSSFNIFPTSSPVFGTNINSDAPLLGPLGDNGGSTETMLPQAGSPSLNAGDPAFAAPPATDQRGGARVVGPALDIGATEVDGGLLAVGDVTVEEDAGSVDVVVTRSGTADLAASVNVATVAGTATAGADFTTTNATVSWASGEAGPKTVTVPILVDEDVEDDEQFTATLSGASGAGVSDAEGAITITDVAPEPAVSALTSLTPQRFADTRPTGETFDGDDQAEGKLTAGGEIIVKVADRGDVPADAVGVIMNVTAVQAEAVGFVTVHGCVTPRPNASSLNYTPDANIGNEVIAGLAADGTVCLYSSQAAHLTVDVVGYVTASSPLVNVVPGRILDTRPAGDTVDDLDEQGGKTAADSTTTLKVAGRAGVPVDAAAVIVNVTAVGPTETGFVTVTPCVSPLPKASSLNHVDGVNRANELVASLDADGQICLYTSSSVHLLVDVVAYVPAGSDVTGIAPGRFLDTRPAGETVDAASQREGKLEAGEEYTLQIGGRGVVPEGAKAVIVNVTAIQAEVNGFITTHPCLDPRPLSSSLNYVPGVNGGNEIVALLSDDGKLCLFTSQAAHLTVDVVAYIE